MLKGSTARKRVFTVVSSRLFPHGTDEEKPKGPAGRGQNVVEEFSVAGNGDGGRREVQKYELFVKVLNVRTDVVVKRVARIKNQILKVGQMVENTKTSALIRESCDTLGTLSKYCEVQVSFSLTDGQNLAIDSGNVELEGVIAGKAVLEGQRGGLGEHRGDVEKRY